MGTGIPTDISAYVLVSPLVLAGSCALVLLALGGALAYAVWGAAGVRRARLLAALALAGGVWSAGLAGTAVVLLHRFLSDPASQTQTPAFVTRVYEAELTFRPLALGTGVFTGLVLAVGLLTLSALARRVTQWAA